jgi:hypothetical protein
MKKKLPLFILLIVMLVQLFALWQWSACRGFADNFYFSSLDLELRLVEGIHTDQNIPLWVVRAFHNKVIGTIFDVFAAYLQFWNISFLAGFVSFAGILGIGAQFYYFFVGKKNLLRWALFAVVLLLPLAEVFHLLNGFSSETRVVLIALSYLFWSLLGYRKMLQEKKVNPKIIIAVVVVSFWYLLAFQPIASICSFQ